MARIPTRTSLPRTLERPSPRLELATWPRRVTLALLLIAAMLSLASVTGRLVVDPLGDFPAKGTLVRLSDVTGEESVGTWFSSAILSLCAVLLAVITLAKRSKGSKHLFGWAALALIFLYLSIDETAAIHEASMGADNSLGVGGPLYFGWVLPASLLTGLAALAYLKFLAALPSDIRRLFLVAAVLLVGGALGVEMVSGWIADLSSEETKLYVMVSNIEELMEMTGTIIFIYGLMVYAATEVRELRIIFSPSEGGRQLTAAPGESARWRARPTNGPGGDGQS